MLEGDKRITLSVTGKRKYKKILEQICNTVIDAYESGQENFLNSFAESKIIAVKSENPEYDLLAEKKQGFQSLLDRMASGTLNEYFKK